MPNLQLTGDPAADELLSEDPFALLTGMLLDQQVPMETAFAGPRKVLDRIGGVDPRLIADYDPEKFAAAFSKTPCRTSVPGFDGQAGAGPGPRIVDRYDGDTARLWTDGDPDGAEVLRRLRALPGFGEQKAKIFLALLGKAGVTPPGWQAAAGTTASPAPTCRSPM